MKTDLAKILSVRGQRGLFSYIAQSRNGAIAESLRDHKRTNFAANAGITTLADISIYTLEGELKLKEVFLKLQSVLGEHEEGGGLVQRTEELRLPRLRGRGRGGRRTRGIDAHPAGHHPGVFQEHG